MLRAELRTERDPGDHCGRRQATEPSEAVEAASAATGAVADAGDAGEALSSVPEGEVPGATAADPPMDSEIDTKMLEDATPNPEEAVHPEERLRKQKLQLDQAMDSAIAHLGEVDRRMEAQAVRVHAIVEDRRVASTPCRHGIDVRVLVEERVQGSPELCGSSGAAVGDSRWGIPVDQRVNGFMVQRGWS
eukprot:Skav212314  [mRNA]  locus=scaffold3374:65017:74562:- [translate_table: standard]